MSNGRYAEMLLIMLLLILPSTLCKMQGNKNNEDYIDISDYAYPDPKDESVYRIAIFGTNDLHGNMFPVKVYNQLTKDFYESGGVEYMGSYISILRKQWGDRFLWLDAGDQFQGAMEFSLSEGKIMNAFYNTKKLNAIGIGNHDFDLSYETLKKNMAESKFDYLVSNFYDLESKSYEFMPNQKKSKIYKVGQVNIGVIGIATLQTNTTTTGFPKTIEIKSQKEIIRAEAKTLREKGAHAVILISHSGTRCSDKYAELIKLKMRTKETKQSACDNVDEFTSLISSLEPGLIDGIVAGHLHGMNHHWINGIPTIQSYGSVYSNIMYLAFDPKDNYQLLPDKISLEGPLPSCGKIFEKTKLCQYMNKDQIPTAGALKQFTFHKELIVKDPELSEPFEEWRKAIEENQSKFITTTEEQMRTDQLYETTLSNIFNDVGLKISGAHVSFMNLGGFRSTWNPGPLNEIDMFNMSPFPSFYVTFEMTGKEVLRMLRTVQGGKIIYPLGGVNLYGKFDSQGYIKVIDVKLFDGYREMVLESTKTYTVCTSDYLANGGSAMSKVLQWYTMRKRVDYKIPIRDQVTDFLKRIPNIKKGMFIDVNHPRVRFLNSPKKKKNGINENDLLDYSSSFDHFHLDDEE